MTKVQREAAIKTAVQEAKRALDQSEKDSDRVGTVLVESDRVRAHSFAVLQKAGYRV